MILTPDLDYYEEQMSPLNPDFVDFHFGGSDGNLAPRILPGAVYGFQPLSPAELSRLTMQARIEGNAIRARAGLPPFLPHGHQPQPVPPPAAVPPPLPPPPVPGALGGVIGPAAAGGGAADTWVAIEDAGPYKAGDVVGQDPAPLPPGSLVVGEKGLVISNGQAVFVKKVPQTEVARFKLQDLRILPVAFDAQGVRRREFNLCVSLMTDTPPQGGGLQLTGPSTAINVLKGLRDQNFTPTTFHDHWVRTSEIPTGNRSIYEHECLSRILESLVTIDQLNIGALQGVELLVRRMQVIREAHRISPASPDYSAADHFMGWKYKRAAQVDADLAAHVATELKNEAAIAKESRKAREEQKQRRQGPPKKGGDGGADK